MGILADIVSKIERERDDYEEYHRKLKRWEAAQRRVRSDTPLFQLADVDLLTFSEGKPITTGGTDACARRDGSAGDAC